MKLSKVDLNNGAYSLGGITWPGDDLPITSSTAWWLSGAEKLMANGDVCVCSRRGVRGVRSANLVTEWHDTIDANPSYKTDNLIKATAEYIYKGFDTIIRARFPVIVVGQFTK
jgi:hypothetical protein